MLDLPEVRAIKPENHWNMDKAGVPEGQRLDGFVLGSKNTKAVIKNNLGAVVGRLLSNAYPRPVKPFLHSLFSKENWYNNNSFL